MKHILTIIALSACANIVSAQETALSVSTDSIAPQVVYQSRPYGYFSYNDVMKSMPEYDQAMKSIDELKVSYDKELERSEKDFSKKYAEYLDGQKSFPENIMLKRQKELQQLMDQSIQFKKEAQELLVKAEKELMAPIHERLRAAIQSVGYENKYAYILNTDSNAYPYIGDEAVNCTDLIQNKLGVK